MVRLSIAIVGLRRAEKLTPSLVTETMNYVDVVVQRLGYNAVSWLRQVLERAYLTARMPCRMGLTSVSRVATTSICWKSEGMKEWKSQNSQRVVLQRPRKGPARAFQTRRSCQVHSLRHYFSLF